MYVRLFGPGIRLSEEQWAYRKQGPSGKRSISIPQQPQQVGQTIEKKIQDPLAYNEGRQ